MFKPLAVEVGVEIHQWDQPGGKAITPIYRIARINVGVGELQVRGGGGRGWGSWWEGVAIWFQVFFCQVFPFSLFFSRISLW